MMYLYSKWAANGKFNWIVSVFQRGFCIFSRFHRHFFLPKTIQFPEFHSKKPLHLFRTFGNLISRIECMWIEKLLFDWQNRKCYSLSCSTHSSFSLGCLLSLVRENRIVLNWLVQSLHYSIKLQKEIESFKLTALFVFVPLAWLRIAWPGILRQWIIWTILLLSCNKWIWK